MAGKRTLSDFNFGKAARQRRVRQGPRANLDLPVLPSDDEFLRAVGDLQDSQGVGYHHGATASEVAWKLGVAGARRLGRGAVKGSWSGTMSAALRVSPRLASLTRRGLLARYTGERYDGTSEYRYRYYLTKKGREEIT